MQKLTEQEFQFLIDAALDTKDEEMFNDIIKRQKEGKFLDFPKQQVKEEVLSFEAKEKKRLTKDLQVIMEHYKFKNNMNALRDMIADVEQAINHADDRLMDYEMKEQGVMPLKFPPMSPMDFPPQIQYMAVSYETAMEAYEKHSFPNEDLDTFVARYFFEDNGEGEF